MDDDYKSLHRTFNFKTIKTEFTPSPLLHIKFNFFFESKLSQWILNQDSTAVYLVGQCNSSIIEYNVRVTLQKFLYYEQTCEEIDRELKICWLLSDDERNRLIKFAWNEAWGTIRSKFIAGYATLDLDFQFVVEERSIRAYETSVVEALVRKMKRNDIDSGKNNTENRCCSICLGDLLEEGGGEAMRLPCWHAFHGGCIKKWLRISKNCPLCRFELRRRIR